jgi:hypothetical protein
MGLQADSERVPGPGRKKKLLSSHRPFLLYVPLPAPQTPWMPTQEFLGKTPVDMWGAHHAPPCAAGEMACGTHLT